jgi:hypothetical protein
VSKRVILDREDYIDGQTGRKGRSDHRSSQRNRSRYSLVPCEGKGRLWWQWT